MYGWLPILGTTLTARLSPEVMRGSTFEYKFNFLAPPSLADLSPEHRGPQSLRSNALHDPACVKSDDEGIGRQVSVDVVVDLEPQIVELGPPVAGDRLAVEARHFQTVGEIGNAVLIVGKLGREEAEAAVCGEEVVGHEVDSIADPARHGDTRAFVYCQCDRGVGLV